MFDNLSDKLSTVFKKLKKNTKITEKNIEAGLKEVRFALLEADVNYKLTKDFIEEVREEALGQNVLQSLTPTQQLIKIVYDKLCSLMGETHEALKFSGKKPFSILLTGLQGSGKTTTAGKLSLLLKKEKYNPFLVPIDIYRPAAIDQLKKIGKQINIPVFDSKPNKKPLDLCKAAIKEAAEKNYDLLIFDSAGRLHIDDDLMAELVEIKKEINPSETLFVADAMTGQDAVNVAKSFNEKLQISGIVLSKMDGDAKGGAALSIKGATKKPLKFIGVGEKLSDFEAFHPDRMASRILGMGDTLTLVEKAQEAFDEQEALNLEKKLKKNQFSLDDFRKQMLAIKKMGSLTSILKMVPGLGASAKGLKVDESMMKKIIAIIDSMTIKERNNYKIIKASHKKRIAKGSGTSVQEINKLLQNYAQTMKMIKKLSNNKNMKNLNNISNFMQ